MQDEQDEQWMAFLPEFAPLPRPFVAHLFRQARGEQIWPRIQQARSMVAALLSPVADALSPSWLQRHFPVGEIPYPSPSRATIGDWERKRLLRPTRYGRVEANSVAAVTIMRQMSTLRRDWMPPRLDELEPWFWVWGLHPDEHHLQMLPYPLPGHLSPASWLLFSSWPGVAWCGWQGVGRGALAWAGTLCGEDLCALPEAHLRLTQIVQGADDALRQLNNLTLVGNPPTLPPATQTPGEETLEKILLIHRGVPLLHAHLRRVYTTTLPPLAGCLGR